MYRSKVAPEATGLQCRIQNFLNFYHFLEGKQVLQKIFLHKININHLLILNFLNLYFYFYFSLKKRTCCFLFNHLIKKGRIIFFKSKWVIFSSSKQSKVLTKLLFGHMAQAYHYFCIYKILGVSFLISLFCYPLNQPAVASVRRRGCVCLHKIRRILDGGRSINFRSRGQFLLRAFCPSMYIYCMYIVLYVVKKFDFRSFFLVSSSYLKSSKTRK